MEFAWGNPQADGYDVDISDDDNDDDGPRGPLAIEDGSVDGDESDGDVTTTQPEQTQDEIDDGDAEPLEDGATHAPVQYTQEELDQQDSQLDEPFKLNELEPPVPDVPVEVPGREASLMPPPAPPSPGTIHRKRELLERMEQIRFGLEKFPSCFFQKEDGNRT